MTGASWDRKGDKFVDGWEHLPGYLKGNIDVSFDVDKDGNITQSLPYISINGLRERFDDIDSTKLERINNIKGDFDIVYI